MLRHSSTFDSYHVTTVNLYKNPPVIRFIKKLDANQPIKLRFDWLVVRPFFFDVVPKDMPPSAINRRLVNYMEFFDDGGWDATNSNLPRFLFLLENPATENRLRRAAHAVRSRFDLDDGIEVYTATAENLVCESSAIWSNIDEPGELLSLDEL